MVWSSCLYSVLRGDPINWHDVVFQYDGTYRGFLCAVYESYVNKEFPIAFTDDEEYCFLYEVRSVVTVPEHAERVDRSISRISSTASTMLRRAFLTCMEDKEQHLYAFVRKLYADGPDFIRNRSDSVCYPIVKALRGLDGELEKLRGFVRFSDYQGVLGCEIAPKNRVLPLLRRHFCNRYANEQFFLYDRTHKELLCYAQGRSRILFVESIHWSAPGEDEICYRLLWKRFFDTIAIEERLNPRCQNTFLPKRYRGTMTEFFTDADTTLGSPAVLQDSCAPTATPALEKYRGSSPSAPA